MRRIEQICGQYRTWERLTHLRTAEGGEDQACICRAILQEKGMTGVEERIDKVLKKYNLAGRFWEWSLFVIRFKHQIAEKRYC